MPSRRSRTRERAVSGRLPAYATGLSTRSISRRGCGARVRRHAAATRRRPTTTCAAVATAATYVSEPSCQRHVGIEHALLDLRDPFVDLGDDLVGAFGTRVLDLEPTKLGRALREQ